MKKHEKRLTCLSALSFKSFPCCSFSPFLSWALQENKMSIWENVTVALERSAVLVNA